MQVLQYMRTDTYMGNEEVVAVVLADVASELTHSCAEVKASLESSQSGQFRKTSRDFLACDATTTTISRGRTAWKRKCCLIRLSCLPSHLQSQLKRCKPNLTSMITVKDWDYGLF